MALLEVPEDVLYAKILAFPSLNLDLLEVLGRDGHGDDL